MFCSELLNSDHFLLWSSHLSELICLQSEFYKLFFLFFVFYALIYLNNNKLYLERDNVQLKHEGHHLMLCTKL